MDFLPYLLFSALSSLLCAVVAFALNRWVPQWSLTRRTVVAVAASFIPAFALVAFALAPSYGGVLLSMSPDEFLAPFAIQIVLILVVSAPVALFVSWHGRGRRPIPTKVFD